MSEIKDQVYKQFLQDKSIVITGEINQESVDRVCMQIIKYNIEDNELEEENICKHCGKAPYDRSDDPITIYISSPGGVVDDCLAIIGAMESSKTPIHTYALGEAASAAFVILACGHKRFSQKYARLMYHEMSGGFKGDRKYLADKANEINVLQDILDGVIISKTKIDKEILISKHRQDWYMSPAEALELGVIDEVI